MAVNLASVLLIVAASAAALGRRGIHDYKPIITLMYDRQFRVDSKSRNE